MRLRDPMSMRRGSLLGDGLVGLLLISVLMALFLGVFYVVRGNSPQPSTAGLPRLNLSETAPAAPADLQLASAQRDAGQEAGGRKPEAGKKSQQPQPPKLNFQKELVPFLATYCLDCHSGDAAEARLSLEKYKTEADVTGHRQKFAKVLKMLRAELMPPPGETEAPSKAQRDRVVAWLDWKLNYVDCGLARDPGRVTIRRLNRVEYRNTIRDLLGVDYQGTKDFPADDVGYGFDNIGDVLSLPPLLMEKYLAAAETIVAKAIVTVDPAKAITRRWDADATRGGNGQRGPWRGLFSTGDVTVDHRFPQEGDYLLRARAYGDQAGGEPPKMEFHIDGRRVAVSDVKAVRSKPRVYEHKVRVPAGRRRFSVRFINDYYMPNDPNPSNRDRNLHVGFMEVAGPLGLKSKLPETHRRIITTTPSKDRSWEAAAGEVLKNFTRRAYRRPVTDAEVQRLLKFVQLARKNGETFEGAIALAMQAVLVSPNFLFRIELDPEPGNPGAVRTINEHELAVRLSYFLWSSMPDAELFRQAEKQTLRANLAAQVRRMIRDRKSDALVKSFVGQWLQLRNLYTISPDPKRFPGWNAELREAMRKETELFFAEVMREDRSIFEFVDADYTFLNERLARHYGIAGVQGNEFRRVSLAGNDQRGGVLAQASVLTVTSDPTRTSPVKRGKWILEQILGIEPPPPPANVEQLDEDKELTGSLRQRMEQHRTKATCAVCHRQMDPLGFGFENYNAIGQWRDKDGRFPIDASGELPNGRKFNGPATLKKILLTDDAKFRRCLTEKLLTYALGRGLEHYDKCAVDDIGKSLKQNADRFHTLVLAIVRSDPFQKRRGKK